ARSLLCMAAYPAFPASSVKELIALAKASPGKIAYGSTGIGNSTNLAFEMISTAAGIKLVHVPYKGAGPALTDVMGGQVPLAFTSIVGALPHVRTGRLKALAVTSKERAPVLPDVPTIGEQG